MHGHLNGLKTAVLLGGLSALVLFAGSLFGRTGLVVALVAALAMNGYAYFRSDAIALRAMHARPITEPEHPAMFRIVRELSRAARQPMPRLYVSPPAAPAAALPTSTSAAPSTMPDALPAWCTCSMRSTQW